MKISLRIQQLNSMVRDRYSHVWDCCCDHGLLGQLLLDGDRADCVHFVDVVPALMSRLETHLQQHYTGQNWQLHCMDVAELPLEKYAEGMQPQLIIIAGIGGDLVIELVSAIRQAHPHLPLEFLLCPVYHNYKVRQALAKLSLGMVNEYLLKEKQHYYEIMHVSANAGQPVSLVGDSMWDFSNDLHKAYLQQTLDHYRRMASNPRQNVSDELQAYQRLSPVLSN